MVSISGSDPTGFSKPSLPGSGMYMEEEAKRLEKPGAVNDTKETASSGYNRTDTYMMSSGTGTAHRAAQVQTRQNPSTGKGK